MARSTGSENKRGHLRRSKSMRRLWLDFLACLVPPVMAAYAAYKGILITNPCASDSDAKGAAAIQFVICLILTCIGWVPGAIWAMVHTERYCDVSRWR